MDIRDQFTQLTDAAVIVLRQIRVAQEAKRESQRVARNERRRAVKPKPRKVAASNSDVEPEPPESCFCSTTYPPCSWCVEQPMEDE